MTTAGLGDDMGDLKEQLAAIEHERWADWQAYVHSKCYRHQQGLTIPAMMAARWERQIATPYAELSEAEKQSDREQVDRYWPLIARLKTWPGLMETLAELYPPEAFDGSSGNPGTQILALTRRIADLEAQAAHHDPRR